jgi:hypothetical protein
MWIACHAKSSSPCSLGPPTAAVADDGRRAELRHELTPLSSLTTVEMFESIVWVMASSERQGLAADGLSNETLYRVFDRCWVFRVRHEDSEGGRL